MTTIKYPPFIVINVQIDLLLQSVMIVQMVKTVALILFVEYLVEFVNALLEWKEIKAFVLLLSDLEEPNVLAAQIVISMPSATMAFVFAWRPIILLVVTASHQHWLLEKIQSLL